MRLLADENAAFALEPALAAAGEEAKHVKTLKMTGSPDPVIVEYALREGYDGIVTKDRYSEPGSHLAAFQAMRDGLRIIELRFRDNSPGTGDDGDQVDLVISNLAEIERAIEPGSDIRHLVLNGRTRTVSRRLYIADIEAELERLGEKPTLDSPKHEDGDGR